MNSHVLTLARTSLLACLCILLDEAASVPSSPLTGFVASRYDSSIHHSRALSLSLSFSDCASASAREPQRRPHATAASRTPQHPSGRRWKARRKRQAFLPSPSRNVSPREERALREQLGYVPPNVCCVSARSGDHAHVPPSDRAPTPDATNARLGRPIAIRAYPLLVPLSDDREGKGGAGGRGRRGVIPFPTLYWLTCPRVSRAVADLERRGCVRAFQRDLEADVALAARWRRCHRDYAAERWDVLSGWDREWLSHSGDGAAGGDETAAEARKRESMREMVRCSGVAGADWRGGANDDGVPFVPSVKCLHSHYAHYRSQLAQPIDRAEGETRVLNLVGQWTHQLLLERCPEIM